MNRPALSDIPNLLTVLRVALAAAFPFADERVRIALLIGALLTEFFDGVLARRFHWESRLGRMLDPVADRILFGTVAITFLVEGRLSWLALAALGARDALVAFGALWLLWRGPRRVFRQMAPRLAGKVTTALQYVVLLCAVFGVAPPWPLLVTALATGLFAAAQYLADVRRLRSKNETEAPARANPG